MKIKKPGKKLDTQYDFACTRCGCEYEAEEYECEKVSIPILENGCMRTTYFAKCPCCDTMVAAIEEDDIK